MRKRYVASEALLDDYVTAIGSSVRTALAATAIRNRCLAARHLLARAALGTAGTLPDLLTAARAGDRRWLSRMRSRVDPGVLRALAQTIALQDLEPDDRTDALAVYELVRSALGPEALTPANQGLHAQLALDGDPEQARRLLDAYRSLPDTVRAGIEVDLLNPFVAARPVEPWLAAFQSLLPEPRPTLGGPAALTPFDRLTCGAAQPRVEAPQRVSVVVTAYRPGEGLITAVRSIVTRPGRTSRWSWSTTRRRRSSTRCSPAPPALGERIRLVRLPANAGTYAASNAGMDAAAGEFVAFQDSDDWSHPRRLELQVRPLLDDRRLVATTSDGLAVTEDLWVTRPGIRSGRLNPSSLLFRRSAVMGRIGYFDRVRKAADRSTSDGSRPRSGVARCPASGRGDAGADPALRRLVVPRGDQGPLDAPGAGGVQLGLPPLASPDRARRGDAVPAGRRRRPAVRGARPPHHPRRTGATRLRRRGGRRLAVRRGHTAHCVRRDPGDGGRRTAGGHRADGVLPGPSSCGGPRCGRRSRNW